MSAHPREALSAYRDGELADADAQAVERHLAECTECSRELAIMNQLGGAMRTISGREPPRSVWGGVHRRITRPVGWVLLLAGVVIWIALGVLAWAREELTLQWAAGTAMGLGLLLLLVGVGYEQYREWNDTRYKDVER